MATNSDPSTGNKSAGNLGETPAATPPAAAATSSTLQGAVSAAAAPMSLAESQALLETVRELFKVLNQTKDPTAQMSKEFEKWKTQLKFAVDASDDIHDSLKEVLDINKKFASQGLAGMNKKSYGEVLQYLKELQKQQEKLTSREQFMSPQGQKALQQAMKLTGDSVEALEEKIREVGDATQDIDSDSLLLVAKNSKLAAGGVDKLAEAFGRTGKLSHGIRGLAKIMGVSVIEKFAKAGAVATELSTWRAKAKGQGAAELNRLKADFAKKYGVKKEGGLPEDRIGQLAAFRKTQMGRELGARGPISGRRGFGGLFDLLGERLASAGGPGGPGGGGGGFRGWMGRQAETTMAAGGGQFGTGLGMRALGGLAGGGEMISGMLEKFSIPLAVADIARQLYDSVAEQNKDIFKTMGPGGLFTGAPAGQGAARTFANAAYNISNRGGPAGGFGVSPLGISKEQNEELIKAFMDVGEAIPELSQRLAKSPMTGLIQDQRARIFGGVQEEAYTTGKQLGLDVATTAKENIKLLYDFGQSQEAVHDLFKQFLQDTKAGGITTTQYLGIIDDITSKFDRMGKSLLTVTGILSLLASTGTNTAQDIKDAMELMLGSQKNSTEQTILSLQQMGPEGMQAMSDSLHAGMKPMQDRLLADLKKFNIEAGDLGTPQGLARAQAELAQSQAPGLGPKERTDITEQIRQLEIQAKLAGAYEGGKGGNLANAAAQIKQYQNAAGTMQQSGIQFFQGLKTSGESLKDVLAGHGTYKLQEILTKVYNVPEEAQRQMPRLIQSLAGGWTKAIAAATPEQMEAMTPEETQQAYESAVKAGLAEKGVTDVKIQKSQLQELAKGPKAGALQAAIEDNGALMERIWTGRSAAQAMSSALNDAFQKSLAAPTDIAQKMLTSTDVIKEILNSLKSLLADTYELLTHIPGLGPYAKTADQRRFDELADLAARGQASPEQVKERDRLATALEAISRSQGKAEDAVTTPHLINPFWDEVLFGKKKDQPTATTTAGAAGAGLDPNSLMAGAPQKPGTGLFNMPGVNPALSQGVQAGVSGAAAGSTVPAPAPSSSSVVQHFYDSPTSVKIDNQDRANRAKDEVSHPAGHYVF